LWFCLFSSSVCRIPVRIFCSGGFVAIYSFIFYLLWKVLFVLQFSMIVFLGNVS
jgi:hypothetical protein